MASDKLSALLEKRASKLLRAADMQSFKDQLDAFKLVVLWWAQSRRIGTSDDSTGKLLDEMRRMMDGDTESERGVDGSERAAAGSGRDTPSSAELRAGDNSD